MFYARPVGEMAKWGMLCLMPSVWDFRIFVWIPEKGDCLLLVWWYTTVNGFITISRYDKSTPGGFLNPRKNHLSKKYNGSDMPHLQ